MATMFAVLCRFSSRLVVLQSDGWTPLHTACFRGHTEAAIALLDNGSAIDTKTVSGRILQSFGS